MMTSINYIYLLQEREFIKTNENIYKLGKTKQENLKRLYNYPNGTQLIIQMICNDCDIIERQLLNIFTDKYIIQKDIGNEYFKGNYNDMIADIYNHIKNEGEAPNITHLYNDIKGSIKETEGINNRKNIYLTMKPNPHITIKEFIATINKMMSKPWLEKYLYTYEQNGDIEAECGKDFYFQAIIEKPHGKSYAHILKELSSSANKVCNTSCSDFYNIINISDKEKNKKVEYIIGYKADIVKHKKHTIDIIWRQQNNLKTYYNVGIIKNI